jgi:hypothetical protein
MYVCISFSRVPCQGGVLLLGSSILRVASGISILWILDEKGNHNEKDLDYCHFHGVCLIPYSAAEADGEEDNGEDRNMKEDLSPHQTIPSSTHPIGAKARRRLQL